MYLVKTPPLIKTIFSDYIWNIETDEKEVFLTFDDGPIPEVTTWILDLLKKFSFKATFFCVGENVKKYPEILRRIISEGHSIGNHTYNHINGWLTDRETYLENVAKCDQYVDTPLFRPPYGKMRPGQALSLKSDKAIIMWDVLSGDFDKNISSEMCLENVINNYEKGSIIVFHDSIKAEQKLRYVLPEFFKHLSDNGYKSSDLKSLVNNYAEAF
ncbi:MAG: polysaccharide deacetylase family protein [Saprospiraceae bacterium]|jgi:peptidoglycan/xylan/chitin deacetylase (PgdA/CDA1 family)|nr:polysaccharide deacetylase family protein [Saprospiraceae bacterium]